MKDTFDGQHQQCVVDYPHCAGECVYLTDDETTHELLRIRQALGRMPYLPFAAGIGSDRVESLADVADVLERFAVGLAKVSATNTEREVRLAILEADVAALRRVLGT